jgi:hypothetical protein
VRDDLLLIYPTTLGMPTRTREAPLASNDQYLVAVDALPADDYNVIAYVDTPAFLTTAILSDVDLEVLAGAAPLAVGFTILDGRTFVIDTAHLAARVMENASAPAIDPEFARFIPADASAVVHTTDLTGLIYSALDFVAIVGEDPDAPDPIEQIASELEPLGLDFEDDLLRWTTGDYALFLRANVIDLAPMLVEPPPDIAAMNLNRRLDYGLIIEATDPDAAANLADWLGNLLIERSTGFDVAYTQVVGGIEVTVLSINAPLNEADAVKVELVIGATDDVFFIATRRAAEMILLGGESLADAPGYLEAQQYALPNPMSFSYADGEGLLIGTGIIPLALLGPSIGSTYDTIVADIETGEITQATPTPTPTPPPTPVPLIPPLTPEQALEQVIAGVNAISSSSISATVTPEGVTLLRFAVTINQETSEQ